MEYSDRDPAYGGVECKGYEKIAIFDQYFSLSRQSRFQGHSIIRRQTTWKYYKIELCLQWPTNRKSYGLSK